MPADENLLFFGAVSASVSHELKNVLAVINEQAGLLGDLVCMASHGHPLDPERLAATATCLINQVRRGDALLTHFNHFAHAPDSASGPVTLAEAAALAVSLGARQAGMHRVSLTVAPGPDATITTDLFTLCRLLDWCLHQGLAAPGPQQALTMGPDGQSADAPALIVCGLDPQAPAPADTAQAEVLADRLGAHLEFSPGSIRILWPHA